MKPERELYNKLVHDLTMYHRAVNHRKSLNEMRGNPASLRIRATLHGVHNDTPELRVKWEQTITSCKKEIKKTLLNQFLEVAKLYETKSESTTQPQRIIS